MTATRRILTFDPEGSLAEAARWLTTGGYQVTAVADATQLPGQVAALKPDLILIDRGGPGNVVGEAIGLLRDTRVPLVFLVGEATERELIGALQAHAVEVLHAPFVEDHVARLSALLDELARRPVQERITWEEQVARNFVDLAGRHKLRGSLVVNRGTPFEGRVVLKDGVLVRASYGPLVDLDALREVLQLEDGQYELDASLNLPARRIAASATELEKGKPLGAGDHADIRPRLLAVDDEPHILTLVSRFLAGAGFEVTVATDGIDAVEKVLQRPYDLVVADLSMPRMDGWEMLKTLKADHRTREVPVIFLSAHDDYRESLRAARAGAHDYLAKTGHSAEVVQAALKAITPRLEALFALLVSEPVEVRAQTVGLQWFLRALNRMASTGVLRLEDDWGTYELSVKDGRPIGCIANVQRKVSGLAAFVRMMVASGARGRFDFKPPPEPGAAAISLSMEELINRACESLNANETKTVEQKLSSVTELALDPELYELFCRIAPPRKVAFAQAVCERKMELADVVASLNLSPEHGEDWFRELLRREVLTLPATPRGVPAGSGPLTPNQLHPEHARRREG